MSPRVLATHGLHYAPSDRPDVLAELRRRRESLRAAGANYWVFEDQEHPGVLMEFLEARDASVLRDAVAALYGPDRAIPILSEVEF